MRNDLPREGNRTPEARFHLRIGARRASEADIAASARDDRAPLLVEALC
jgi:hypothetical protein